MAQGDQSRENQLLTVIVAYCAAVILCLWFAYLLLDALTFLLGAQEIPYVSKPGLGQDTILEAQCGSESIRVTAGTLDRWLIDSVPTALCDSSRNPPLRLNSLLALSGEPLFAGLLAAICCLAAGWVHGRARRSVSPGGEHGILRPDWIADFIFFRERVFFFVRRLFRGKRSAPRSFDLVIELIAHMARIDGRITGAEAQILDSYISSFLGRNTKAKLRMLHSLRTADSSSRRAEEALSEYAALFGRSRGMREHLLDVLVSVAWADGGPNDRERAFLALVIKALDLEAVDLERAFAQERFERERSSAQFEEGPKQPAGKAKVKSRDDQGRSDSSADTFEFPDSLFDAYRLLGCMPGDELSLVKTKYRALALRHHPDRLLREGLSVEMLARATARFQAINAAFEMVEAAAK